VSTLLAGRPVLYSGKAQYTAFRTSLGLTQPTQWIPGIKRPGREANHSPPSSVEFNTWCLIKYQEQLHLLLTLCKERSIRKMATFWNFASRSLILTDVSAELTAFSEHRSVSARLHDAKSQKTAILIIIVAVTMGWDCLCGTGPLTGPLSIPQTIYEWIWSSGGIILTGENRRTRRETCPSATLSTTNPTGLNSEQTRASAVRSRWLTAWAMARPCNILVQSSHNYCSNYGPEVGNTALPQAAVTGLRQSVICFMCLLVGFNVESRYSGRK
jgi:hypothetical protein